jgi:Bacterial virulence factor lipase N-terminal
MKMQARFGFVIAAVLSCSTLAIAQQVHARFDFGSKNGAPFPSDRFTVSDPSQLTGIRVNLGKPNCVAQPSQCADINILNTLDGFNPQPRLSIPFDGTIDLTTVSNKTVFLLRLGKPRGGDRDAVPPAIVGINQVVWDPNTNALHAESDDFLDQGTRYALIVTDGIHDRNGNPVMASPNFRHFFEHCDWGTVHQRDYCHELRDAVDRDDLPQDVTRDQIVVASVFTTESVTAILEKIRLQLRSSHPAPADFKLGSSGERTVFALSTISGITWNYQYSTAPAFAPMSVPVSALSVFPESVANVAFGRFSSPDYESPYAFIPQVPTKTGYPKALADNKLYFVLFIPAGTKPADGWPVVIFGHAIEDSKQGGPFAVASTMASHGIATIAITAVGHGGGPLGTLVVNETSGGSVTLPAGGRGIDQNGDGQIGVFEGLFALPPYLSAAFRDGVRQTAIDLMQLDRLIQSGIDVDGDGSVDLDTSHVFYAGQSLGGLYGTVFLATDPAVKAGVVNVAGGPVVDVARLSPQFQPLVGEFLAAHVPSLANLGGINFDANIPLRNQPPVVNTVFGADAIQEYFDVISWIGQSGDALGFAPHIRKDPLDGELAKAVIVQFAKGDKGIPNPTATALIRAGDLADRATYFRNDIAYSLGVGFDKNPHTFLTNLGGTPPVAQVAVGAQQQIAVFLASGGLLTIDPDGPGRCSKFRSSHPSRKI